jgi:ABC-type nickel/cobalt efflux system permease component RcnA
MTIGNRSEEYIFFPSSTSSNYQKERESKNMLVTIAIVGFIGFIVGAIVWVVYSTYRNQREWSIVHKEYREAQDALKVQVRDELIVNMDEYPRLKNVGNNELSKFRRVGYEYAEFVSGKDYVHAYEYYYLISADPRELRDKLQAEMDKYRDSIEAASIFWGPILRDILDLLEALCAEDPKLTRSSILGFYRPITKEQFDAFKKEHEHENGHEHEHEEDGDEGASMKPSVKGTSIEFLFRPFSCDDEGMVCDALQKKEKLVDDDEEDGEESEKARLL